MITLSHAICCPHTCQSPAGCVSGPSGSTLLNALWGFDLSTQMLPLVKTLIECKQFCGIWNLMGPWTPKTISLKTSVTLERTSTHERFVNILAVDFKYKSLFGCSKTF